MLARMQRVVNRPYRKLATGVYTWLLIYLGLLWVASVWDFQGFAVGLMWLVGLIVLPVAYLQPTNLALLSVAEWLNKRDDPKKWDVIRVGVLLFICVMSAGGLSILLSMMSAGKAFPLVIPLLFLIIATQTYAGKVNTEKWMKVLAFIAGFILIVSTLKVMPFEGWSRGLYESTGYSVDVAPSRADVVGRKALTENKKLAEAGAAQCILEWKKEHMSGMRVVTEDELTKAITECQKQFMPPSSHKEGSGSWLQMGLAGAAGLIALHAVGLGVIAAIAALLVWLGVRKKTESTTKTTSGPSWVSENKGRLILISALMALLSPALYTYVTQDKGVSISALQNMVAKSSQAAQAATRAPKSVPQKEDQGLQFLTPDTTGMYKAQVISSSSADLTSLFGDNAFEITFGENIGARLAGGQQPYVIHLGEVNRIFLHVAGSTCANRIDTAGSSGFRECSGSWNAKTGSNQGRYELKWNASERFITLHTKNGGVITIKLLRQ